MDQIDTFIKEIIDTKQLPGITEEAKLGLLEEMRERLLDLINRALIDALTEEQAAALSDLLDREDVSDTLVHEFITQSGVDVDRVTTKTMLAFRDLYLQTPQQRSEG